MSHELSFTNGRADFFELSDGVLTAWHQEGISLPRNAPLEVALAAGNLLYPVAKEPVFRQLADGSFLTCASGAVTVRSDRNLELGLVGADYSVVQNAEAFALLQPLLDNGSLRLETGGVLRDGADAWVLAQINLGIFPEELRDKLLQQAIAKYVLVRTNHTGRANASVTETDVRVVCANTLGMVEDGSFKSQAAVQHRGDAAGRLDKAFTLVLGGMVRRAQDFLARYEALQSLQLDAPSWQRRVMDVVQRDPRERADFDAKSPQADATVARYEEKRVELHRLWSEGDGHQGDGSAWEAYNGVAQAVDHNKELFPVRASRVRQLIPGGRLYGIKDAVFGSLLELAEEGATS